MKWSTESQAVIVEPFSEPVGPSATITPSILENFQLFFTASLTSLIAQQTNLYARQVLGDRWSSITEQEVLAFIGFSILMGINQLPALVHYWRRDPYFRYSPIADRIPRDRFLDIWRFLHFVDNTAMTTSRTDPNYDRLWKVRPILDMILKQCQQNYHPHREQSIDEAMIKFKGRSSMKQYMPKKPTKRGFKVWVRADSVNGYVCQYEVYTGKQGSTKEVGLGGNVVVRLTRDLVGRSYHVFVDNFFSSIDLFLQLLSDKIYATGTLRANRKKFPSDLVPYVKRGLPIRGNMLHRQDGNISVVLWQDTKPVLMTSTAHDPTTTITTTRKKTNGSTISIECPKSIADYNKFMGGVDIGDQYRKYYQVRMKSKKAYKYIFWFLVEVSILNAFILHRYSPSTHRNPTNYLDFRVQLAKELIGDYNGRKRLGRPPSQSTPLPKRVTTAHFPLKATRGRCRHCKTGHTVWFCSTCDLRLCHSGQKDTDCFLLYHRLLGTM